MYHAIFPLKLSSVKLLELLFPCVFLKVTRPRLLDLFVELLEGHAKQHNWIIFFVKRKTTKEYSSQLLFVVWKFWAFILEDRLSGKHFVDNKWRWRDREMRFIMERKFIENCTERGGGSGNSKLVQVNLNEVFRGPF